MDPVYLYLLAWAAVTKHHRPGGLNNRTVFLHSSGGQKSTVNMLMWSVSGESFLPGV